MPTQRGGYGYSNYSDGDYGTEGVVHESGALSVTASATTSAQGGRDVPSGALSISANSSIASFSADRDRLSSATISASATITASGEDIIYEDTDKYSYGSGLYGMHEYTNGDLQTIVSAQSSTVVANGIRIQQGSATVSATSGESADSEKIYQGSATSSASVSILANGAFTVNVQPNTITSSATITPSILRIRNASGITTVESGELTHAREKWEVISSATNTWTDKASSSTTWTELVA